jgi:hypothetical protein
MMKLMLGMFAKMKKERKTESNGQQKKISRHFWVPKFPICPFVDRNFLLFFIFQTFQLSNKKREGLEAMCC